MKLCFSTDQHLATSVGRRKGAYVDDILEKEAYISGWAAGRGCSVVVWGGDLYDRPTVPRSIEQAVADMLDESSVPRIVTLGQHCIGVGQLTTAGRSIHFLHFHRNVACVADPGSPTCPTPGLMLYSNGCPDFWKHKTWQQCDVAVVHNMLSPAVLPFDHIHIPSIEGGPRVVLSGDLHTGFPVFEHDGTLWANPGALSRTFRSQDDLTRHPRFAVVDTDDPRVVWYEDIPDEFVRPVSEVYDKAGKAAEIRRNELRHSVSEAVAKIQESRTNTWASTLENARKRMAVANEIAALERLEECCRMYEAGEEDK